MSSQYDNGSFHIKVSGVDVTGSITVPNTGGSQIWQTVTIPDITLPQGWHVLRIALDANGTQDGTPINNVGNINWIKFIQPQNNSQPYLGVPFEVGDKIEAEFFDHGGQNIAYHDLSPEISNQTFELVKMWILESPVMLAEVSKSNLRKNKSG